jgi:hypothetical protein
MHRPVAVQRQAPLPAANFNQQILLSESSNMNQPAGLIMIQHHLSLWLTPEAWVAISSQIHGFLHPLPPLPPVPADHIY